ncbi:MAG: hypothetical protein OHK0039_31800 [Bacteroidia bacterium]
MAHIKSIALIFGLLLLAGSVRAQFESVALGSDERVRRLLDDLGYQYEVTSSGNYKCIFRLEEDRTQLIVVQSKTNTYRSQELREVWSLVYLGKKRPNYKVCLDLLSDSERKKWGNWEMTLDGDSEQYYIAFTVKLPADVDAETLNDALRIAAESADEMEVRLEASKLLKTMDEY